MAPLVSIPYACIDKSVHWSLVFDVVASGAKGWRHLRPSPLRATPTLPLVAAREA